MLKRLGDKKLKADNLLANMLWFALVLLLILPPT
jgi:hypothetical protein